MAFDQGEVDELLARTGRMCAICNWRHQVSVHHIVPVEADGTDDISNAIPLCPTCHDAVHASYVPGRTTRQYTVAELRLHLQRTIARAAGMPDLLRILEAIGEGDLADGALAAKLPTAIVAAGGAKLADQLPTPSLKEIAQQVTVSASAAPASVTAFCPVTITFAAELRYTGRGGATIRYVWLRSDGGVQPAPSAVTFDGPGTIRMQTTWTLGDPSGQNPIFKPYHGWAQVQLLTDPPVMSNQAAFSLMCLSPIT